MSSVLAEQVKTRLKAARNNVGLKQQDVAGKVNSSRSRVSAHENIRSHMQPDVEDLEKYAELYGVSPLHFLDDKASSKEPPEELVTLYYNLSPSNQQVILSLARALSVPDPKVIAEFIRAGGAVRDPE